MAETSDKNMIPNTQLLGEVTWLYSNSDLHREWQVQSMMQWVMPAIMYRQFRIYHEQGKAIAYVAWAYLSEEVEEAYMIDPLSLQPKDWKSGDRGWIVDFIVPFGHLWPVVSDLRSNVFRGEIGKAIRVKRDVDLGRIFKLMGRKKIQVQ